METTDGAINVVESGRVKESNSDDVERMIHPDLARDIQLIILHARSVYQACSKCVQTGGDDSYGKAKSTGSRGSQIGVIREDSDHASW